MHIQSITLVGYDRFALPGVTTFKMDMNSPVQIIVGTNGCGKTSLLAQLSPLPPTSSDFPKGGRKDIRIFHKAKQYHLSSSYHNGHAEHQFMVNGDTNLNVSRKETEQKLLVKEHFGLTLQSFNLIVGFTKFTEMSKQKRQEWLMTLSGIDFDYVMRVFRNAKEKHRDYVALTKGYAMRENDEVKRLEELRRPEVIEAELIEVEQELANASSHRNSASDVKVQDHHIDTVVNGLRHDTEEVFKLIDVKAPAALLEAKDLAEAESITMRWSHQLKETEHKLRGLYKKKEDLSQLLEADEENSGDVLVQRKIGLEDKLSAIVLDMGYFTPEDTDYISSAEEEIFQRLGDAFSCYKDNREMSYSKSRRDTLEDEHRTLTARVNERHSTLATLIHQLSHAKDTPSVDCPNCDHVFAPGIDPSDIERIESQITVHRGEIESLGQLINVAVEHLGEFTEFQSARTAIYEVLRSNKRLKPLLDETMEMEKTGCNAAMLKRGPLMSFHAKAKACQEYRVTRKDLDCVIEAMAHSEKIKQLSDQYRGQFTGDVDHDIEEAIQSITSLKVDLSEAKVFIEQVRRADRHRNLLTQQLERLGRMVDGRVKTIRGEVVDHYVAERQRELTALTEELSRASNIKGLIDTLSGFRKDSETKLDASKKLVDALSPTDGLIAEYLGGFLVKFVAAMNALIAEIWSYDFQILPCITENGEIDYRFPVLIGNKTKPRNDISETSAAQTDVINLAFRLIAMRLLGLEGYPFFIDEPPPTMDEAHRMKMNAFIKNYLSSGQCSQIFMVSHYVSNHGIFTNADFCVLDATNIVNMPSVFNKHVVMK